METDMLQGIQRLINTAFLHQKTFSEFKNKFHGKKVVLVGAGPTLNYFEPIEDAIYVGVNRTFLNADIKFDYLFTIDKAGLETTDGEYYEDFFRYREDDCIKFVGDQNLGIDFQIPENKIVGKNIRRYKTTAGYMPCKFALDIDSEPLGNFASVGLQAIQFILYGNPKEIYLVGFDCSITTFGYFKGGKSSAISRDEDLDYTNNNAIQQWKELKDFRNLYYPDTKLISVNPVNLRGVFDKDIYSESYKNSEDRAKFEEPMNAPMREKYGKFLAEQSFDKKFASLCKSLSDKKLILYGAGEFFDYICNNYDLSELNIIGISDKRFTKYDRMYRGLTIIKPCNLEKEAPDCILVTLLRGEEVINYLKQDLLRNKNYPIISLFDKNIV